MKRILALATLALAAAAPVVQAQSSDTGSWIVRGRALYLDSANKDDTGLGLTVNNKWFPEVDFSYFFSPNLAMELVLTYPQKHSLYSNGTEIATLKHLPPTLLLQYHYTGLGSFRPYAGVGLNYTYFSDVEFSPAVAALRPSIERDSYGLALQVGVDVPIGGGWLLNFDMKKVQISTDVFSGSTKVGTFKIDPMLYSVGVGLRF
jgi:outer membrane protein